MPNVVGNLATDRISSDNYSLAPTLALADDIVSVAPILQASDDLLRLVVLRRGLTAVVI